VSHEGDGRDCWEGKGCMRGERELGGPQVGLRDIERNLVERWESTIR